MTNENDDQQPDDDQPEEQPPDELTAARLIRDAEQQARAVTERQARLLTALEREQFTGPVHAAEYAGERAYHIAHTRAERDGAAADEAAARGKRAFWAAYFTDLAEEATVRAESARAEMRRHGDPDVGEPR
jgi:hypothetical protein